MQFRCPVYILSLVGENAGGGHAHDTLHAERACGIEDVGVNNKVVVGHVKFSRHILEEATDLSSEVDDVGGAKGGECSEALVVPGGHPVKNDAW